VSLLAVLTVQNYVVRLDSDVLIPDVVDKNRVREVSQKLSPLEVVRTVVEFELDRLVNLCQAVLRGQFLDAQNLP